MFHFFGRMRGNGRKAAPDYRLLDYADHLRFIRPFVQARYGSEPAQEILSILKDSADDEWTYSRSRKALQPLTGRGDAEFLARVELMASEAIGGVNSAIGAANECGTRMERRLQVFAPDGMKPCASCRMLDGLRTGLDEPFTLPGGHRRMFRRRMASDRPDGAGMPVGGERVRGRRTVRDARMTRDAADGSARNPRIMSLETAKGLADALGVTLDDFWEGLDG